MYRVLNSLYFLVRHLVVGFGIIDILAFATALLLCGGGLVYVLVCDLVLHEGGV